MFKELRKAHIEPLVTLSHYEMPLYFVTHGEGWASREVVDHFVRYAEVCFNRYKDLVKYWLTFNEVDSVFRHPFTTVGIVEENYPSKLKAEEAIYKALHHQLVASALATKLARQINPQFQIGCMVTKTDDLSGNVQSQGYLSGAERQPDEFLYTDVQVRGEYPRWIKKEWSDKGFGNSHGVRG